MLNRKPRRGRHRYTGQPGALRLRDLLGRLASEVPQPTPVAYTPAAYTPPTYEPPAFDAPQTERGRLE